MDDVKTDVGWMFCASKRRFRSQAQARRLLAQNIHRYGRQTPYRCDVCGGWHLTKRWHKQK